MCQKLHTLHVHMVCFLMLSYKEYKFAQNICGDNPDACLCPYSHHKDQHTRVKTQSLTHTRTAGKAVRTGAIVASQRSCFCVTIKHITTGTKAVHTS